MIFEWAKKGPHDFNQRGDDGILIGFERWVGFKLSFTNYPAPEAPWGHEKSGVRAARRESAYTCPSVKPSFPEEGLEEARLPHSGCSRDLAGPRE